MVLRLGLDEPTTSGSPLSYLDVSNMSRSWTYAINTKKAFQTSESNRSASRIRYFCGGFDNSSCRSSGSNITTRTEGGRSWLELTDGQLDTRSQSASTMVSTSTTTTMTTMLAIGITMKFADHPHVIPNRIDEPTLQRSNRQGDHRRIRTDLRSNDNNEYDNDYPMARRRRRRFSDGHDDHDLNDYPTGFSTTRASLRQRRKKHVPSSYDKSLFSSVFHYCRIARRSILLALVLLSLIMTSSAAPPAQRRDDSTSVHLVPQHISPISRDIIPSSDSEPLSVRDGFIPFSIGNSTVAKEQSKNTFYSLGHDINTESNPPIIIADKPKKKNRKPGRRKPALSGRSQALQVLVDAPTEQRCEGQKFKQRIRVPGCLTKTIVNRFCFGTCASYFIPRMSSKKLKAFFKSCSTCGPREYDSVNVTLDCPGQDPPQVTQSIIKVKKCACINVDLNS